MAESFPEDMTVADWEALLRTAAEKVGREWAEANGYVRLFDKCECVDAYMLGPKDEGYPVTGELPPDPACPSCDGTGRVLRDGATGGWVQNGMQPCVYPTDDPSEIEVYVIPASWMETE